MKFYICAFIIFIHFQASGQSLVVNGGFEDENICTEYKKNCAPEGWLTNDDVFFNYFKDAGRSHAGSHYLAIEAGHAVKIFKRTFIRTPLLCNMRKGSQYAIEFYVKSQHPILDSIGVLFTGEDFLFSGQHLQQTQPSFYLVDTHAGFPTDSLWKKIAWHYTAYGGEGFMTIANFSKRDVSGPTHLAMENNFFVFIDDVAVVPVNPNEKLCDNWQESKQRIYDQDERHEFLRREIRAGKSTAINAIDKKQTKLVARDTITLPAIFFESSSAQLKGGSDNMLDNLCTKINTQLVDSVVIEGHTDSVGNYASNQLLSTQRASAVKDYLQAKTGNTNIYFRGRSFLYPLANNQTDAGRKQNRRVVVILYIRE